MEEKRERGRLRKKGSSFADVDVDIDDEEKNEDQKKTTHCGLRLLLVAVLLPVFWRDRDEFNT